LTFAETLKE